MKAARGMQPYDFGTETTLTISSVNVLRSGTSKTYRNVNPAD